MPKSTLPDWEKYWENFTDLNLLRNKLSNLDETLQYLEKEFATKLMSGDHIQIITYLEERIEQLEHNEKIENSVVQADLFEVV